MKVEHVIGSIKMLLPETETGGSLYSRVKRNVDLTSDSDPTRRNKWIPDHRY